MDILYYSFSTFIPQFSAFTSRKEKISGCPCPVSSAIHAPKV